ncbi:hypothetical protein LINPERHAP2_LOCUS37435 [Linum perenne]
MPVCALKLILPSLSLGNISLITASIAWNMRALRTFASLVVCMGIRRTDAQIRKSPKRPGRMMRLPQRRSRLPRLMLVFG